jgi:hypothetical protein
MGVIEVPISSVFFVSFKGVLMQFAPPDPGMWKKLLVERHVPRTQKTQAFCWKAGTEGK